MAIWELSNNDSFSLQVIKLSKKLIYFLIMSCLTTPKNKKHDEGFFWQKALKGLITLKLS